MPVERCFEMTARDHTKGKSSASPAMPGFDSASELCCRLLTPQGMNEVIDSDTSRRVACRVSPA